ncbi:hypothetical protein [Massilia sp. TS11]|nr:hypothetical protein [Massilia sp. TS11]MCG2582787.1 hypothetical protein [Massilia sp. TS11]
MTHDTKKAAPTRADSAPKFGRLLVVLLSTVLFLGLLTWVMATFFPDFG